MLKQPDYNPHTSRNPNICHENFYLYCEGLMNEKISYIRKENEASYQKNICPREG